MHMKQIPLHMTSALSFYGIINITEILGLPDVLKALNES